MAVGMNNSPWSTIQFYAVPTISRLLKITDLLCKRALQKSLYSAKETSNLKGPTNRSHPISRFCATLSQLSVCCVPPYHNCLYVLCHPITTFCMLCATLSQLSVRSFSRDCTTNYYWCWEALQMSLFSAKELYKWACILQKRPVIWKCLLFSRDCTMNYNWCWEHSEAMGWLQL